MAERRRPEGEDDRVEAFGFQRRYVGNFPPGFDPDAQFLDEGDVFLNDVRADSEVRDNVMHDTAEDVGFFVQRDRGAGAREIERGRDSARSTANDGDAFI